MHALAKHHFYHPNPTASDFTPKHTQSTDSISKILESKSGSKSHKTRRSCSFFSKSTASKFKLESAFSLSSRASEALFLSSRADEVGVAIHTSRLESTLTKLDSSISAFLNLIDFTQAHFLAVFFSPFLWLIGLTPRSFVHPLLLAPCNNFSKTNALFATAETMDCHADFQSARNDGVWEVDCHASTTACARNDRNNATFGKVDSRSKAKPTHHDSKHCGGALHSMPKPKTPQATGFLMTKPTPKSSKMSDSRILETESWFFKPRKEIRLERLSTPRGDEIHDFWPKSRILQKHLISFFKESL